MAIKYNIDALLEESRPVIVFRGVEYLVRDLTVRDIIQNIRSAKSQEDTVVEIQKDRIRKDVIADGFTETEVDAEVDKRLASLSWEDSFADYLPVLIETLTKAIVDFPSNLIETITIKEYKALQTVLTQINSQVYAVNAEDSVEGEEAKKK